MYEAPIKRAGLSMNRILYSNTKMVMNGFPALKPQQFNLSFKFKTYENGRLANVRQFTSDDLDDVLPARGGSNNQ